MDTQRRSILVATALLVAVFRAPMAGAAPIASTSTLSTFFEPGAVVMLAESRRSGVNQGAFIAKFGVLRRAESGRAWGASIAWLYSDRAFYSTDAPPPEKRLWLFAQHRRPIGDGFFRYWGVSGGIQVWESIGEEEDYEILSAPVILESDIGLAGFLSLAIIAEFFSARLQENYYASENGVTTLIEGASRESSFTRLSISLRFSFGS